MQLIYKLKELEKTNPDYKSLRYFDCDGDPSLCDVFLIGINPATGLPNGKEFWEYWNDNNGFALETWLKDYTKERKEILQKKTERSPTRNRIEALRQKLKEKGHALLNCNVYTKQTPRASELKAEDKNLDVFQLLLNELKPKFLILHGRQPKDVLHRIAKNFPSDSVKWQPFEVEFENFKSKAISAPHLFNLAISREKNEHRNLDLIVEKLFDR